MTIYGCGLRLSEARHLKTSDITAPGCSCEYATARGQMCCTTFLSLCVGEIYVAMVSQLPAIRASS